MRLGGEVHDDVDLLVFEGLGHRVQVPDVAFDKGDPVLQVGQVGPVAGIGEHVVGDHPVVGMPIGPETDEIRPDEAGTAGDQKTHDRASLLGASVLFGGHA